MYRTDIEWIFGFVKDFPNDFQGDSTPFVPTFLESVARVNQYVSEKAPNHTGKLHLIPQKFIHSSLAYLCCIREEEIEVVQKTLDTWWNKAKWGHLTASFNRLECWKVRPNTVTNIIIGDDLLQEALWPAYMDLMSAIRKNVPTYNPLVVPRQDQMPFHITLVGASYGSDVIGGNSIDPALPTLASITRSITKNTFELRNLPRLKLDFKPHRQSTPVIHNAASSGP